MGRTRSSTKNEWPRFVDARIAIGVGRKVLKSNYVWHTKKGLSENSPEREWIAQNAQERALIDKLYKWFVETFLQLYMALEAACHYPMMYKYPPKLSAAGYMWYSCGHGVQILELR